MSIYFFIILTLKEGIEGSSISLLNGVVLFCIMYLIMLVGNKLFKKESLGGGDIKLMFIFGMILGPLLGIVSIFIGSCLALPISLVLTTKKEKNIIPFGPFLLIALSLLYLTGINEQLIFKILGIL
jgi:prepilin signal peptidase PulO-like enzyme (type II secretory pathway)